MTKTKSKATAKKAAAAPPQPPKGKAGRKSPGAAAAPQKPWEGPSPAARLCRAADASGIGLDQFVRLHRDRTAAVRHRFDPKELTDAIVAEARKLDAAWNGEQKQRFARLDLIVRAEHRVKSAALTLPRSVTAIALSAGLPVKAAGVIVGALVERKQIRKVGDVFAPAKVKE